MEMWQIISPLPVLSSAIDNASSNEGYFSNNSSDESKENTNKASRTGLRIKWKQDKLKKKETVR